MFESVSDEVKLQLAEIYPQKHTFKYIMQQMQQQTGPEDCEVFAAVVCTALALGSNPSNIRWNQSQMRPHLLKCLVNQNLTLFPTLKVGLKQPRIKDRKSRSFPLYCVCNKPQSYSQFMVKCIVCDQWYHNPCVNFSDESCLHKAIAKLFTCSNCTYIS